MFKRISAVLTWLISLTNPPPLHDMNRRQKVSRVFVFTITLILICILSSMAAATGIFMLQSAGHVLNGLPELAGDITIIFFSMLINAICIMVLMKVKNADQKLFPPENSSTPPPEPPV